MSGLDLHIKAILNGKILYPEPIGASNAFAFSRKKIVEGLTTLIINAHQPLEGQVAFYEAHLISDEGLNIHGGTFPGAVSILHGVTSHYGWAHTSNFFDKIDVYQLTMKKPKSNFYQYDNEWLPLEIHKAKMKVKIGPFRINISKKTYWSKYGATLKTKHGVFSLRLAANQEFRAAEQWYRMGKCKNFQEFYKILKMQALPVQNITYADQEDNIFFIANGLIPRRMSEEINWSCAVAGNTCKTYWEGFLDISKHPQVLNPKSGYVFNVNHTPFQCTAAEDNPNPENYPCKIACFEMEDNNRSLRFRELYQDGDTISIARLKAIKYDLFFPKQSHFMELVYRMQNLDEKFPEYKDICSIFKKWNRSMDTTNVQATIFYLAFTPIFKQFNYSTVLFRKKMEISDSLLLEGLKYAKKYLLKNYKTLEVRFGDLLRHRRGNKDYAIGGYPDVMASMMGLPDKDGKFKAMRGEDLIIFAYFNETGLQKLETIKAYGSSSRKHSPHFNDQMELYLKNGTKIMTLDLKIIQKNYKGYQPK
jgi:acyl-homoserine-lactone acylase